MSNPASPCTGICRIAAVIGRCEGCQRTLKEIADWPMLSPREQRVLLAQLQTRR